MSKSSHFHIPICLFKDVIDNRLFNFYLIIIFKFLNNLCTISGSKFGLRIESLILKGEVGSVCSMLNVPTTTMAWITNDTKNWQKIGVPNLPSYFTRQHPTSKIIIHFVYSIELVKKKYNTIIRIISNFFPASYAKIIKKIISTIYICTRSQVFTRASINREISAKWIPEGIATTDMLKGSTT